MAELDADAMTLCTHCTRPREEHYTLWGTPNALLVCPTALWKEPERGEALFKDVVDKAAARTLADMKKLIEVEPGPHGGCATCGGTWPCRSCAPAPSPFWHREGPLRPNHYVKLIPQDKITVYRDEVGSLWLHDTAAGAGAPWAGPLTRPLDQGPLGPARES